MGPPSSSTIGSSRKRDAELKLFNNGRKTADKSLLSWEGITNFLNSQGTSHQAVRQRRQAQSAYGDIDGLPLSFIVTLPQSCCTNALSTAVALSNLCKHIHQEIRNMFEFTLLF
jgi:hypothetical protein